MKYFDEYVFNYDMNDPDINYKYHHSYRVMNVIEELSKNLNMNEYDIHLAKIIGLLHDIGRFEQDKLYDSFKDSNMDHGDYAITVLKETNILDKADIKKEDYEVVYKAIKNHNKYEIEPNLTERELLFSKLVRDADKLDILYVLGEDKFKRLKQDNENISKEIENDFFNNRTCNLKYNKSLNDNLVVIFGFIYDFNFKISYQIINDNKYYDKIYERINRKDIFEKYIKHTNNYIKGRID